ncbi:hypothetical protein BCR33DRAFT_313355 [Rhizoclosmatium globosum]|uniref:Uncharacterized protein n=1 Tax=Rhizoclosmatium globosum TaxID=329046 RepID=A0A1Y2CZ23_9FUNG|nr:hypothetical protein BCR33DRAFT_313355 [Rhizoclosmatium globosum]|eukprot:ORY52269.1 hypothetical protein BCR33DRAFT_313355 [Rhizoclosmatium globosum]
MYSHSEQSQFLDQRCHHQEHFQPHHHYCHCLQHHHCVQRQLLLNQILLTQCLLISILRQVKYLENQLLLSNSTNATIYQRCFHFANNCSSVSSGPVVELVDPGAVPKLSANSLIHSGCSSFFKVNVISKRCHHLSSVADSQIDPENVPETLHVQSMQYFYVCFNTISQEQVSLGMNFLFMGKERHLFADSHICPESTEKAISNLMIDTLQRSLTCRVDTQTPNTS